MFRSSGSVAAGSEGQNGSAVSRRRQALVARGSHGEAPPPLSGADVQALKDDPSAENRATIAGRFGRQYDELAQGHTRDLANAVLGLLVRDVEKQVRRSLAETVASSAALPAPVASRLARDDIEVARPILEQSPILSDAELIDIVRTNAMQYALAVAGRTKVSENVSEVLVEEGNQEVVARLAGNAGASLSSHTLSRIVEDYSGDAEVQERLVRRPALPYELVEQMVGVIGDRLEWELIKNRRMPPDQARAIMQAVRERASIGLTAREHGDRNLQRYLRDRYMAGELGHDEVLAYLRDGEIVSFEFAMALHAGMDVGQVRGLIYSGDRRKLAATCIKAGFSTPHYLMLRVALELAEKAVGDRKGGQAFSRSTLEFLQKQYDSLRADPDAVDALIEQ